MFGKPDKASDRHRRQSEHDLRRYPDIVKGVALSLRKAHDMYSLGTILVEVSYWQRIDEIFKTPKGAP